MQFGLMPVSFDEGAPVDLSMLIANASRELLAAVDGASLHFPSPLPRRAQACDVPGSQGGSIMRESCATGAASSGRLRSPCSPDGPTRVFAELEGAGKALVLDPTLSGPLVSRGDTST